MQSSDAQLRNFKPLMAQPTLIGWTHRRFDFGVKEFVIDINLECAACK